MPRNLLSAYPPATARYDEMLEAPHTPRAHWRQMFEQLAATAPETLRERAQWLQRQVRENGVTYNVYADPEGADRPWELDMLPLIIPADGMGRHRGGGQAARDAAQPRARSTSTASSGCSKEGLLPPALIYGHSGFLRPCRGIRPPGGVMLHMYAADLARAPDGSWWVVDDRTQAPSGAGYALENRLVISRLYCGPVPRPAACSAWPVFSPRCATASRTGPLPTARRRSPCW